MDSIKINGQPNPREKATLFSVLFWCWTINLFKKGYRKDLTVEDLYDPLNRDRSNFLGDQLEKQWDIELKKSEKSKRDPNLLRALFHTFRAELFFMAILHTFLEFVLKLGTPILLGLVLQYFESQSTSTQNETMLYALSLSLASVSSILVEKRLNFQGYHLAGKIRIAVCSLVYRKAVKLSKTALGEEAPGKIVNLIANDANKFDFVMIFLNFMWSAPLMAIVVAGMLYVKAGFAALVGVGVMLTFVPIQMYMGKLASNYRLQTSLKSDARIRLMDEIIAGIQVIKLYAWEKSFCSLVESARKLELRSVRKSSYVRGFLMSCSLFMTRVALYSTVVTSIAFDETPTIDKVFVISSLYIVLSHSGVWMFVRGYAEIAECRVSVDRIQSFLLADEFEGTRTNDIGGSMLNENDKEVSKDDIEISDAMSNIGNASPKEWSISMENVSVKWNSTSSSNTLEGLNCKLENGKLYVVIGSVGSGKSTLLSSILGETTVVGGRIKVNGKLSYASQEAWIFGATVRQNILFGQSFKRQRYQRVVEACSLLRDFQQFPEGDLTDVGERGDTLSGGQKARISLARAVYREADVYLLDDPLSAVDARVGRCVFDECVNRCLAGKTRILVTHRLQCANNADGIIRLDEGRMQYYDSCSQLLEEHPEYTGLMTMEKEDGLNEKNDIGKRHSSTDNQFLGYPSKIDTKLNVKKGKPKKLKDIMEKTSKGSVDGSVFLKYFRSGSGSFTLCLMITLFIVTQCLISFNDHLIPYIVYTTEKSGNHYVTSNDSTTIVNRTLAHTAEDIHRTNVHVYVYTSVVFSIFAIGLARSIVYYDACLRSNERLHGEAFASLVRTSMRFFNANPSGRILNRFSKDTSALDDQLLKAMLDAVQTILLVIGGLILTCTVNPVFLAAAVVIGVVCYSIRRVYLKTSKNVKRLEGMTRSPVFTHLNATLNGITTIRAHQAQELLKREFDRFQDIHTSSWFMFLSCSLSYAFALDIITYIFIQFVTFSFLIAKEYFNGAQVGLAITQMTSIAGLVQWGMRQSAEVANHLMSVERVLEYTQMPPEDNLCETNAINGRKKKPSLSVELATMLKKWPDQGALEFKNVYMRYAADEGPVLKNLNFFIEAKQKIGIIGRTGAGKSSLIAALFRLAPTEGTIEVDNMNIGSIPLECLRSRISIIPQDPVLFSGTLRHNLDPFNEYSDEVIWEALEEVELKGIIIGDGLDSRVMHRGSNFSVGQRQLVCLARALLRKNQILMMDEATANVDPQTDALIQRTIRTKFLSCTVLTVAHRLNTIIDSDKVIVMDNGCLVEFDHPYALLQNDNGHFSALVKEAGEAVYQQFLELTKKSCKE